MSKSKVDLALKILIGGLMVVLVVIIVGSMQERIVKAGDTAPDFSVTTDHGVKMTPSNFGGRVLVLHFWASWCEPCAVETAPLNAFTKKVAGDGVVVLGVSIDANESAYRRFIDKYQVAFQTARDPNSDISASYGTFKVPETYIIDRTGKVVQKIIGDGAWDDAMVNYVKSL
ncbi:MAG TPA: TlpA disulfide reductase family protein [Bryobacteraceae bacterium]|nr:TlpA disulfide reductase family protein [Bryobacteraceae bacterium]